jgi:hypothetical protein
MPPLTKFFLIGLLLAVIGLGGLLVLIVLTLPNLLPRWLFFFFIVLGLTGLALPVAAFLNWRFVSSPPVDGSTVLRQAIWVGIYGALLVWLSMGRILNPALAGFLAVGFIAIELFMRIREQSRFKPKAEKRE